MKAYIVTLLALSALALSPAFGAPKKMSSPEKGKSASSSSASTAKPKLSAIQVGARKLVPRIRLEGNRLDLSFESPSPTLSDDAGAGEASGSRRVDGEVLLREWRDGASMIALEGGGFAPLPADWLQRFGHRVADLLEARDESRELATCALPSLALLCDDLEIARPPSFAALAPLLEGFEGIPRAQLPADLTATLRDYQRAGVDWLHFLRDARLGALLADDMGLGKTLQALCSIRGSTLVVAPTSVLHCWADELKRFRPGLSFQLYHGPGRVLQPDFDVTLTSYAILRQDVELLTAVEWETAVLDEAQNIKNPDSQVAQAAYRLRADFRIALTGTPVENRLDELWSQLHFINRGLVGGRRDFQARTSRPMADGDDEAAQRLRDRIRPFVLRRLKSEVAPELPPRTEIVLHVELSESEREVYDAVRAASVARAVERLRAGGGVMEALEALLRLRQAACHSGLVPGQSAESSAKISTLVERLDQAAEDGHRALVFSQWTNLLDRIEPHLRSRALEFERLDGSTRDRAGAVARFQAEDGPPVMLVSLRAGGTGLTLTAADHIFLMDPWWNPAVEDQAADRAHRIGQSRAVVVHRLVALDTVEERILALHEAKRALSRMALKKPARAAASAAKTSSDCSSTADLER